MHDDDTKVLNFLDFEHTFLKLKQEVVEQDLKYLSGDEVVGSNVIHEDQNIIHVNDDVSS